MFVLLVFAAEQRVKAQRKCQQQNRVQNDGLEERHGDFLEDHHVGGNREDRQSPDELQELVSREENRHCPQHPLMRVVTSAVVRLQQNRPTENDQSDLKPVDGTAEVVANRQHALENLPQHQHENAQHRQVPEEAVNAAVIAVSDWNRLAQNDVDDERHHEDGKQQKVAIEQQAKLAPLEVKKARQHRVEDQRAQLGVVRDFLQRRDFLSEVFLAFRCLRRHQEVVIDGDFLLLVAGPSDVGADAAVEEVFEAVATHVGDRRFIEIISRADVARSLEQSFHSFVVAVTDGVVERRAAILVLLVDITMGQREVEAFLVVDALVPARFGSEMVANLVQQVFLAESCFRLRFGLQNHVEDPVIAR